MNCAQCAMCILDPVRTMLRTKLSQRNCSLLTLHNMINIALFTAQNKCTHCWPGGRFFLSRYDGGSRVMQRVSLRVSDRILLASIPC